MSRSSNGQSSGCFPYSVLLPLCVCVLCWVLDLFAVLAALTQLCCGCLCSLSLPQCAMALSAVCDCHSHLLIKISRVYCIIIGFAFGKRHDP